MSCEEWLDIIFSSWLCVCVCPLLAFSPDAMVVPVRV